MSEDFDVVEDMERDIAAPFIRTHHYSGKVPTSDNIFFGCYVEGELFAVANYGRIASRTDPKIILNRADAVKANTLELRRLCRVGAKNVKSVVPLSKFLAKCHDILRKRGYRYILSYSDQFYNKQLGKHSGGKLKKIAAKVGFKSGAIYYHSGFTHIGETPPEMHCEDAITGERVHRSRAYRKMLAHNVKLCERIGFTVEIKLTGESKREDRIWPDKESGLWATDSTLPENKLWTLAQVREHLGLVVVKCPPKDKWLLDLESLDI